MRQDTESYLPMLKATVYLKIQQGINGTAETAAMLLKDLRPRQNARHVNTRKPITNCWLRTTKKAE